MAFAVSCALKEDFCDCLSIVCTVAWVLPDEHETSAFPLISPACLTSSGCVQVSRDGFSRRETYQKRFFSLTISYILLFFVVVFKLTFLLSRGSFLLAISKVQFNQLFLMALERNKWARPWAELRTITSTSTRALSRSVNWVFWVSSSLAGCEGIQAGQRAWALIVSADGITDTPLVLNGSCVWRWCVLWMKCCWWKGIGQTLGSGAPFFS